VKEKEGVDQQPAKKKRRGSHPQEQAAAHLPIAIIQGLTFTIFIMQYIILLLGVAYVHTLKLSVHTLITPFFKISCLGKLSRKKVSEMRK
jgi:hypothetical protein